MNDSHDNSRYSSFEFPHRNEKSEFFEHLKTQIDCPLSCKFCKRVFGNNDEYKDHKEGKLCSVNSVEQHEQAEPSCSKKYGCINCDSTFGSKKKFQLHIVCNHGTKLNDGSYCCKLCNVTFPQKKLFCRHFQKPHCNVAPKYECKPVVKEPKRHLNYQNLQNESNQHDSVYEDAMVLEGTNAGMAVDNTQASDLDEKFKCAHCDRNFKKKHLLTNHIKIHFENYCDVCKKEFLKYRYYRDHLSSLSHREKIGLDQQQRLHKCNVCDKTFSTDRALSVHFKRLHDSNRTPKKCPMCNFSTMFSSSLQRHVGTVHTNERKYICEQCGSCFNAASGLKDHKLFLHSTERNFSCDICGRGFKVRSGLNRHLKCHAEDRPAKCFCGQSFKLVTNLRKHQVNVHGRVSKPKKLASSRVPDLPRLESQDEEENIEDLDIQPMSVLADVNLSPDEVICGSYSLPTYEEKSLSSDNFVGAVFEHTVSDNSQKCISSEMQQFPQVGYTTQFDYTVGNNVDIDTCEVPNYVLQINGLV